MAVDDSAQVRAVLRLVLVVGAAGLAAAGILGLLAT